MKVTEDFGCFSKYRINENKDNSKGLLRKKKLWGEKKPGFVAYGDNIR